MPQTTTEHIDVKRERQARRGCARLGLTLVKSRCRNPWALEFGQFMIVNPAMSNAVVAGGYPMAFGLDLADVEAFLIGNHGSR